MWIEVVFDKVCQRQVWVPDGSTYDEWTERVEKYIDDNWYDIEDQMRDCEIGVREILG